MEIIAIVLSGIFAAISPVGVIVDSVIENSISSRVENVELLKVRVDNAPNYQILEGKADRIRIAARGLELIPDVRIDTLELETDPVSIDLQSIGGKSQAFNRSLKEPLQGGVRLIVTEKDINRALESQQIQLRLQNLLDRVDRNGSGVLGKIELTNVGVKFLDENRLRVNIQVERADSFGDNSQPLDIMLELGIQVEGGRNIQLIEPKGTVDGKKISPRLLEGFTSGISKRLDLQRLQKRGIALHILKLDIDNQKLNMAAFIRVDPEETSELPAESKL